VSSDYPAHLETDVLLRDGSTVRIRPARADDAIKIEDYLIGLSPETRRLRFWGPSIDVRDIAAKAADIDYRDHLTLIALTGGSDGTVVAGAQYIRADGSVAEIGLSVADELQGHGLGSILVAHLAQAAEEAGIRSFYAEVLPENHRMIGVFRQSGFELSIRAVPGMVRIDFPTTITEASLEQYEERDAKAAANAVRTFLEPHAVAIVGASRDPGSVGGRLLHNLLDGPFSGIVYPVNPNAEAVQGVPAYASIADVPAELDTVFVAIPAAGVLDVARACADKNVRGLVVISSGFAETGGEGAARQAELLAICRSAGMRLIGPNCMGVANTDPEVRMHGTFASARPPEGRVGFMSQSGALGLAVMSQAASMGLGLSSFVSVGNKADISGNDLLCYWDEDDRTDVLLLYLESFGNPRRFGRLARRIGRRKPIVAVKSGRSAAGVRAAGSHTGALLAASDTTVDALFRQHGVIRCDTLEEMFDVAILLANQPVPAGDRVAILTNAGGLGILCADTCEARGLRVPTLSDATTARLREFLPTEASVGNPVDMIASATGEDYGRTIRDLAADPDVDALIVIYIPPLEAQAADVARHMVEAIAEVGRRIPLLTCFMSSRGIPDELRASDLRIPSYSYPEQAAIALSHATAYGVWRDRPESAVPELVGLREDEATAILASGLERGEGWLTHDEVVRLLDCYGLPRVRESVAATPNEAAEMAASFGGPVVLKALGPVHKTEVEAVRLGLTGDPRIRDEAEAMAARIAAQGEPLEGFVVQEMLEHGVEMLVGVVADRLFGPVVACGAGGTAVELTRDVAVRVAPLTETDAREMVASLATAPLLEGFRGAAPADVPALLDVIHRVSAMALAHPSIAEMDLNPVIVLPHGAAIVDARVGVREQPPAAPFADRASVEAG
jgi:acetyl coenzyme A synthetase (ADP forming)-like protein